VNQVTHLAIDMSQGRPADRQHGLDLRIAQASAQHRLTDHAARPEQDHLHVPPG
jgi:hypothetical protein